MLLLEFSLDKLLERLTLLELWLELKRLELFELLSCERELLSELKAVLELRLELLLS